MSKKVSPENEVTEQEAFEIIELAIDDIELLTRAFHVIDEICNELDSPRAKTSQVPEGTLLN